MNDSRPADPAAWFRSRRRAFGLVGLVFAAYALFVAPLANRIGPAAFTLAVLPALAAAWFFGWRGGLVAGALIVALNWLINALVDPMTAPIMLTGPGGAIGTVSVVAIGVGAGYVRDLTGRLQRELAERRQIDAALRESEERFHLLFESSPDAIFLIDPFHPTVSWPIVDCNEAAGRMNGYRRDELVGQPMGLIAMGLIDPEGAAAFVEQLRQAGTLKREAVHRRRDGTLFPVEVSNTALVLGGRQLILGIDRDISQRKQVEEELRRARDELEQRVSQRTAELARQVNQRSAAYRIAAAALSTRDPDELFRIIHDIVGELMPARNFYIALHDADANLIRFPYQVDEFDAFAPSQPPGRGLTEYVLRTGRPVLASPDVFDELVRAGEVELVGENSIDWLGVPLKTQGRTIGVLAVQTYTEGVRYTDEHKDMLVFVSSQIAMAIERKQADGVLRRYADRLAALQEIDRAILAADSPEAIARAALSRVRRLVRCDQASMVLIDYAASTARAVAADGARLAEPTPGAALPLRDLPPMDIYRREEYLPDLAGLTGRAAVLDRLLAAGARCAFRVPLVVEGELIGQLNLIAVRSDAFDEEDKAIAREVAGQLSVAVQQTRLREALQRHAAELELRVAERTRELADANERLTELDRLKSKFVSDVSHELRTPVTNLSLYLNLLERGKPEKHAAYMNVLKEQAARLGQLIEDILDLSRLELSRVQLTFAPVDLNALAEQVVVAHRPRAESAGLSLRFEPRRPVPDVWGDYKQLHQVVTNLVANAISYTRAGEVSVSTLRDPAQARVCLQVRDTGLGIDPEDLPHVFDRFYRGRHAGQSDIPGTGLGLAIVKEIVELHGGQIQVESTLGRGSAFRVWLPVNGAGDSHAPAAKM